MKSIFALFDTYEDTKAAVQGLLERDFMADQMNVIILEQSAKNSLDDTGVPRDGRAATMQEGLDDLVTGQSAVNVPDTGSVVASGELASTLVRTAAASGKAGGLRNALVTFSIPDTIADAFALGVAEGKILFWIRVDDKRAGVAEDVLIMCSGHHTGSYGESSSPALR